MAHASSTVVRKQITTGSSSQDAEPAFPTKDIIILAAIRFAEPISFTSINPYLFFMIRSFGKAEQDIGYYAGIISACFPLAEFATGIFWGRLSDRIGRKKVILICLGGCILPTLFFGLSRSVWQAVLWRTLTGLINGNAPVIATACAELVTYKPHQALAFSIVPISWSIGAVIGPVLGGLLSDPTNQYPGVFHGKLKDLFRTYRYALPNMVAAFMFFVTFIAGIFLIKETKEKSISTIGTSEESTSLLARARRGSSLSVTTTQGCEPALIIMPSTYDDGVDAAVHEDDSNAELPNEQLQRNNDACNRYKQLTFLEESRQFTGQIYLNLSLFAVLCFHSMSADQIHPIFSSTSTMNGGLDLTAGQVGFLYSFCSIIALVMQTLFPWAHNLLGSLGCLRASSIISIIAYIIVPSLVYLPRGKPLLIGNIVAVLCFRAATILGYPSITILLTNAVPKPSSRFPNSILGTVNGLSQSVGSAARGFGPLFIGPVFSLSLGARLSSLVWLLLIGLASTVLVMTRWSKQ